MAEEESSVTMAENAGIGAPNIVETQTSNEAAIDPVSLGGTESNDRNHGGEAPANTSGADEENSLDYATELDEKGDAALKESDFEEAVQCFGSALKIRVSHYGDLSPECFYSYYHYGRARLLLHKAKEETNSLGEVPKKDAEFKQEDKDESVKNATNGESSAASFSNDVEADGKFESKFQEEAADIASGAKDHEAGDEESDGEDLAEADEDESDLDLAWKLLDVAREIAEKHPGDTLEKVNVQLALADLCLEQDDIETSLSNYRKALPILERIVEPDSRLIAKICFRIGLCLEIGSKPQEAIPYCQRALSIFKSRIQRLKVEVKTSSASSKPLNVIELEAEIETLNGLSSDLEKKLLYLQQFVVNPNPYLSEILGTAAAKANDGEKNPSVVAMESSQMGTATSHGGFDSPTLSSGHTIGAAVTHLGMVGQGVKRVLLDSETPESSPLKKPTLDTEDRDKDHH